MNWFAFFNNLSTYTLFLYNFCHIKQKKDFLGEKSLKAITFFENKNRSGLIFKILSGLTFWAFLETFVVSAFQYLLCGTLNVAFGKLAGTGANYFGLLLSTPILLMTPCLLFKIEPRKQFDLVIPALPLALVFVKIACFMEGCCRGVPWEYGLVNHYSGQLEFPTQLLESALALLIFIFLSKWKKKAELGTMYPIYLIVYSGTRFFSEFTRIEPAVVWIFKRYHILCMIGVVLGLIELALVRQYNKKKR